MREASLMEFGRQWIAVNIHRNNSKIKLKKDKINTLGT
jgi:hypothetical protein